MVKKKQLQKPLNPQVKKEIFMMSFWSAVVCNYKISSDTCLGITSAISLAGQQAFCIHPSLLVSIVPSSCGAKQAAKWIIPVRRQCYRTQINHAKCYLKYFLQVMIGNLSSNFHFYGSCQKQTVQKYHAQALRYIPQDSGKTQALQFNSINISPAVYCTVEDTLSAQSEEPKQVNFDAMFVWWYFQDLDSQILL